MKLLLFSDRGIDRPSTLPVRPLSSTSHDHNNNNTLQQQEDQQNMHSNNNNKNRHIQQPQRALYHTEDVEQHSIVSGSSSTRDR